MKEAVKSQKPRKKIQRICQYCLGRFYATRRDAMYCSPSCRQRANITGESFGYYSNPAEHFLAIALGMFMSAFLKREGRPVIPMDLHLWINQSKLIKSLFFDYLDSSDYYKRKFINVVDGFLEDIEEELNESNMGFIRLSIPHQSKRSWMQFLDAMEE